MIRPRSQSVKVAAIVVLCVGIGIFMRYQFRNMPQYGARVQCFNHGVRVYDGHDTSVLNSGVCSVFVVQE